MENYLASYFLPAVLHENFTIVQVQHVCELKSKETYIEIAIEENNIIRGSVDNNLYESKGFTTIRVQDFPIRGIAVYLYIKRRRWRLKSDAKQTIRNDYSYLADGAGFTRELSDFLKGAIDTREDTITNIASYYGVKAYKLRRHYKKHSSGYATWEQQAHASAYMLFPENIGSFLSIDEVSLSQGELYTFVTNKFGKGRRGTLVASIKGTLANDIISVLNKLPIEKRMVVKEVTLDMAKNLELAMRSVFTGAVMVSDRFHVVMLLTEGLQHKRIKKRWEEMEKENEAIRTAKAAKKQYESDLEQQQGNNAMINNIMAEAKLETHTYQPEILKNGETPKQLLARSNHLLVKKESNWTDNQRERAVLLFERYPDMKEAYHEVMAVRNIYEDTKIQSARERFTKWIEAVEAKEKSFLSTVANTIKNNLDNILNFFLNRNTNANAESFNAKIKLFRANQRGVVDTNFFLFRLAKIFA